MACYAQLHRATVGPSSRTHRTIAIQQRAPRPVAVASHARMRSTPCAVINSASSSSAQLRSAYGFNALLRSGQKATVNLSRSSSSTIRCGPYPPVDEGNIRHIYSVQDFERELEAAGDKMILIDISNRFCGPCKMVYPSVLEMSEELTNVTFLRLVGDHNSDTKALIAKLNVRATPNFHFYHRKAKVFSYLGSNPTILRTHMNRVMRGCSEASLTPVVSKPQKPQPVTDNYVTNPMSYPQMNQEPKFA